MKKVVGFFSKILDYLDDLVYFITYILSNGFFFYFYLIASILYKIFPLNILKKIKLFFKEKQNDTLAFLSVVFIFLIGVLLYTQFYPNNEVKHINNDTINGKKEVVNNNIELNLYKKYAHYDINNLNFKKLKKDNKDIVSWIMVDNTNINYPVVKTKNNDYYLNHDISKKVKSSGWIFMDYRNNSDLSDDNTIIYGHNLVNKTAFGSLSNLYDKKWYNESNHYILVVNDKYKYLYEIFSVYVIEPELYYLQNNFNNKEELNIFFNELKNRSIYNFKVSVDSKDKIITLSTCTDDNKQRRVVHAKLKKKIKLSK